ncbi:MAG TPA: hypothetical protein VH951_07775 [Dehalococcoidia bacterium]|jgi:hypothetical protein
MKNAMPWWSGAAGLGWLAALVAQAFLTKLATVDVASQTADDFLRAIATHRVLFTAEVVAGAFSVAFALLTVVTLARALLEDHRDEYLVGAMFAFSGSVILLVAFAMYGNLVGTAMEFVKGGLAPSAYIAQQGDIQGDQFEIIFFVGQLTQVLGLAVLGAALVRRGYLGSLFGFTTIILVALAPLMYHMPLQFTLAQIAWIGMLAWQALTGSDAPIVVSEAEA